MRWILNLRVCIIICLAVVLISAAVIFSVSRAVLPYATGYKNEIQQKLSEEIGLPVEIESIDAAIHWFSPRLRLIGVSIFDEKNKVPLFNFQEAFVELDVIASAMHRDIIVDDVGLIGAELSIEKLSDNEWLVQGIKFTSEGSNELPEKFLYMIQNSNYLLHDSDIYYQDHTGEKLNLDLVDVNIDVKNKFNNHDIKFSMNLPEMYGGGVSVVANLNGEMDSLNGDIYIEARQINVKQWNQKFGLLKTYQLEAVVDVSVWATLEDNVIQALLTDLSSTDVSIKNNTTKEKWATDYLASNIRYVRNDEHWDVAVTDFSFGDDSKPAWNRPVNILASDDEEYFYLSADFLRVDDLRKMAYVVLNDEQLADIIEVDQYQLNADIYNLNIKLPKETFDDELLKTLYLDASVVNFSMQDKATNTKVSGVDASLHYDERRLMIDVQTEDAEVELNNLFRGPLVADVMQGQLVLDYIGSCWQLSTDKLQLKNSQINTFSRFDIRLSEEQGIFIDAETDFYDAYAKYTKTYLPTGIMKQGLVDWLDMAIIDGYVPEGKFILHGNMADFPYKGNNGVFQVLFTTEDADLLFLKKWPRLANSSSTIKFNNSSLNVSNAKASTGKAVLFNASVEIKNLLDPHLTVSFDASGKTDDIQSYVLNSPLDDVLGDAMRLFQFEGKSNLNLKLDVPLNKKRAAVDIEGRLNFVDTSIYYSSLGYEIEKLNGTVYFTRDSVFAEPMMAFIDNKKVSLNVFTRKGELGNENVFHLDGILDADYLLQSYKWVPDQWLSGQSKWSVDIEVPYKPKDYKVHINAQTTLQGVSVQVSDRVQKGANEALNLNTSIDVLHDKGLLIKAKMTEPGENDQAVIEDNIVDLYGVRNDNNVWGFDVKSKYMAGKGEFTEGLGKDTSVELDLKNIDLHALFFAENKGRSKTLKPSEFPPLNWKAEQVLWDGWLFTDVVLNTDWNSHGMLINKLSLKGPAMAFDASGTWLTDWRNVPETVLQGKVTSHNIGETLTGLGFQRSIDRSNYVGTFDAKWSAEPYGWSWANMKGKTIFEMQNGEILEVDPGAGGRLLGLLNIFELANRLAFNFDDVTREGFSFDYIKGEFEFVNGDGSLKNFDVSAPAADINMFGSVGLIERDFGLLMRVKPHTDSLTFAGGAILGGVVVGAGLALIQKVFDLGVIGHNVYSVTGSWDDPQVEQIIEKTQDSLDATDEDGF